NKEHSMAISFYKPHDEKGLHNQGAIEDGLSGEQLGGFFQIVWISSKNGNFHVEWHYHHAKCVAKDDEERSESTNAVNVLKLTTFRGFVRILRVLLLLLWLLL